MARRIAREWLWLLGGTITAIGLSFMYRDAVWRVGETGVVLVSLYGLSVVVRTTIWARNERQEMTRKPHNHVHSTGRSVAGGKGLSESIGAFERRDTRDYLRSAG